MLEDQGPVCRALLLKPHLVAPMRRGFLLRADRAGIRDQDPGPDDRNRKDDDQQVDREPIGYALSGHSLVLRVRRPSKKTPPGSKYDVPAVVF